MSREATFIEAFPDQFFLKEDIGRLQEYLLSKGLLEKSEVITAVTKAGEGNMNLTLRAETNSGHSFIIKQARPWVEKYPEIKAPAERAVVEGTFYSIVQKNITLRAYTPELYYLDRDSMILVMEDLGHAKDYTGLYADIQLTISELKQLCRFLSVLHNNFTVDTIAEPITNTEMKQLNHEHIFVYPFAEDNGFDLDTVMEGLQAVSLQYKRNEELKKAVRQLGGVYMDDGPILLHGDYYPGSWLNTDDGIRIIDPEFCFCGPAEFDVGVMLAHLLMGEQLVEVIANIFNIYESPDGFDKTLCLQFAGVEVMRRIMGLAQLPLTSELATRKRLLKKAAQMILQPESVELSDINSISS